MTPTLQSTACSTAGETRQAFSERFLLLPAVLAGNPRRGRKPPAQGRYVHPAHHPPRAGRGPCGQRKRSVGPVHRGKGGCGHGVYGAAYRPNSRRAGVPASGGDLPPAGIRGRRAVLCHRGRIPLRQYPLQARLCQSGRRKRRSLPDQRIRAGKGHAQRPGRLRDRGPAGGDLDSAALHPAVHA